MFEYQDSPPPLLHSPSPTSDPSQFPSRDTTPTTPVSATVPGKKSSRERQLPWFKRPIAVGTTTTGLSLDTTLLDPDFEDDSFPLFGAQSPSSGMAGTASAVNLSARHTSTSPRGNQPSTLTSALQRSASGDKSPSYGPIMDSNRNESQSYLDPNSESSRFESGARPITVKGKGNDKMRRESLAQSMGTGMSWGGISVGSWIRDE